VRKVDFEFFNDLEGDLDWKLRPLFILCILALIKVSFDPLSG
jgi:hypothetical protein